MLKMIDMSVESNESLTFYKYLCQKIGSDIIVRIRRLAITISDLGERSNVITSGSKGEGLNLKGSDLDVMVVHPYLKVFQSEQEVNREKLITILTSLYGQGINCFASSYTLHDYKSQSYESTESLISRNSRFMQQILPTFCSIRRHVRADRVLRLLYNFLHSSRTALSRILFALQISEVSMHVPEVRQNPNSSENKNRYYIYKHDLIHLVIGFNSDAVSGLLKLASFFYVHKNYGASLTVITYALQKYTDEKIYTRPFKQEIRFNPIQKHVLNLMKKEKLHTMIKTLAIFPFTFELESPLIPQELHLDVTRTPTSFYPLSFAHFLTFLCSYHLHDISSCRQSLQRLKHDHWTLSSGGTVVFEPESLNTMIFWGLCYQLMGETYLARETFREAAKQDRYNASSAASRLSQSDMLKSYFSFTYCWNKFINWLRRSEM
ncbi:unnamed protein product [Mytilus edulis]|uniref:Uncharacterized protein n=1 Tax=Mytilus edulis TaxID=6550 RepID=A0A8S3QQX0_MYTED|nr:unnamed protein product [Mytilus edulis]